jgi:serine beta-lactamase-like protein LACTB, mitochondrial
MTPVAAQKSPSRAIRRTLLCVLLFFAPILASAQQKALSDDKRAAINKASSDFLAATSAPGIATAVVLDGQLIWSSGFGLADLENNVPATPATLFRLGSISKPITAAAAMQLAERGKLDLDAPVQKYCPAFPEKQAPITTRQLLGHLGGIRHYNPDGKGDIPEDSARHFATMQESLTLFASDPLVAPPGTKFNYSTYGYTVIGCVIEGASAQKFTDYVRENVFRPAAMDHTQADDSFAVIPHRSRWYHKDANAAVQNAGVLDSSYKIPGGGFIASADDMARFAIAMLGDRLLNRKSRDAMWTAQKTADGKFTAYGLGWGIGQQKHHLALIGHTGSQQGASTCLTLAPERQAAVVVLSNMDGVDTYKLADEILTIVLDLQD